MNAHLTRALNCVEKNMQALLLVIMVSESLNFPLAT